jgi:3-hydroxyisobutyrate dehydrogenase-like beta-hydroxyacid dehydrogenase
VSPVVSIMAQGGMGAATAARLVQHGVEVRTITAGRSAASAERAAKAGMRPVSEDEFIQADFILSIVPPVEAIPLAKSLAPALMRLERKPIYVDLNAINPNTAMMVEMVVAPSRCHFVDGGIIGLPPRADGYSPVYYVSGPEAEKVAALREFGLKINVLDGPVGAASALKMAYAGITKGLIGVATSMILAAHRAGISEALYAELGVSQQNLLAGFRKSVPDMFGKAGRWVAEMEEIAGFAGDDGRPEGDLYAALARLYERIGKDFAGPKTEIDVLRAFFPE